MAYLELFSSLNIKFDSNCQPQQRFVELEKRQVRYKKDSAKLSFNHFFNIIKSVGPRRNFSRGGGGGLRLQKNLSLFSQTWVL